jgi:hypothetical protein
VRLKAEGDGPAVRLYVGDKLVTSDTDAGPRGSPGAFAMSGGCFVFDDVSVELPR